MTASVRIWPPTEVWVNRAAARADFVDEFIPKGGVGCELGVYRGDFTRILLDTATPKTLHLIDPWELLGTDWESFGVWGPTTHQAHQTVLDRYANEIRSGQVQVHTAHDLQLLRTFDDNYFDWAYIDTIHEHDQCLAELNILKTKVKPDGVIAGDDYVSDPHHPSYGIHLAIHEFAAADGYDILHASDDDAQFAITQSL